MANHLMKRISQQVCHTLSNAITAHLQYLVTIRLLKQPLTFTIQSLMKSIKQIMLYASASQHQ